MVPLQPDHLFVKALRPGAAKWPFRS